MNRNSANKVILVGHLGNQPEIRYTSNDVMTTTFNLATNAMWKDDNGDFQERTDWHRIVAWRNIADYCKTLNTGQMLYVEGHLQSREWTDKDSVKHYVTEVVAETISALGARKKGDVPELDEGEKNQK